MTTYIRGYKKDITGNEAKSFMANCQYGKRALFLVDFLNQNGFTVDQLIEAGTTNSFYIKFRKFRGRKTRTIRISDHFNGQDSNNTCYFSIKKPLRDYKQGYDINRINKLF